jgi:heme-degrading monooxygenase HmoA
MHARISTFQLDAARIDDVVSQLEEREVPEWEQMDGFKGFTLMADRESGKLVGVSFWESADAMSDSEERLKESRQRAAETGGASGEPTVDRFEVLIDTMA